MLAVVLIVLLAHRGLVGGWCVSAMQWLLFSFGLRQSCLLLRRVRVRNGGTRLESRDDVAPHV